MAIIDYNDDDITNNYKQQIRANEYILPEYIEIIEKLTDIDINRRLNCSEILHILKKVFSRLKEASIDDGSVIDDQDQDDSNNLVYEKSDQLVLSTQVTNDDNNLQINRKYKFKYMFNNNNLIIMILFTKKINIYK